MILAVWTAGLHAAAINWTITARKPRHGFPGSAGVAMIIAITAGMMGPKRVSPVTRRPARPQSVGSIHRPRWGAAMSGGPHSPAASLPWWRSRWRRPANGRRLIAEFPLPRMTTRRLMIAVAVIGIEAVLIINVTGKLGGDLRSSGWPSIVFCLAVPPTLVLLPACGVLDREEPKRAPRRKQ